MSILSLHLLSDVPHIVDSALCSHSACKSEFLLLVVSWTAMRLIASTIRCHLASSTLFLLLLPFHAGVLRSFCPFWPCHSWDLPFPYKSLPLPLLCPQLFQLLSPASHPLPASIQALLPFCFFHAPPSLQLLSCLSFGQSLL